MALYTSRVVRDESRKGDPREVKKRLAVAATFSDLAVTPEAEDLATRLIDRGVLPAKANLDAYRLAIAAMYRMEYLVSWNCRHIVNTDVLTQAFRILGPAGYNLPRVCTPDVFMRGLP